MANRTTPFGIRLRLLTKGLVMIASLLLLGWALKASGVTDLLDARWMDRVVRGHGFFGELAFLALASVVIGVGLPRQAVCFLAGYAFGLIGGTLLASLASLLGCFACFFYARLLGRELVQHKFAGRVQRIDAFLHDNPITMTVLIRFLPVGSNLATNLVAGVSSVPPGAFLVGSLIGYLPQTVCFVLLGSGRIDPALRVSLSVALFVASALLGLFLYKRLRHGRSLDASIDRAVGEEDAPAGEPRRGGRGI